MVAKNWEDKSITLKDRDASQGNMDRLEEWTTEVVENSARTHV